MFVKGVFKKSFSRRKNHFPAPRTVLRDAFIPIF